MHVIETEHTIELTRRNLVTLLAKLDDPESARTLLKDGWRVRAVEDAEHYSDRRPGIVHDPTIAHALSDPELRAFARGSFSDG